MTVLFKIFQVVLALAILIVAHEFGHYIFSKIFKTRVDKFYLFFDPFNFYLFSTKRSKWFTRLFPKMKDRETDYGIGWLPLGGYCKISGMVDESMDKETMASEPQPWEFRSKAPWKRLFILAGGVLMNFIAAILIYTCILSIWGEEYLPNTPESHIWTSELAQDFGFHNGDVILDFDGKPVEDFSLLQATMVRSKAKTARVLRNGREVTIHIDHELFPRALKEGGMFTLSYPFIVESIPANSLNAGGALQPGDTLKTIQGVEIKYYQQAKHIFKHYKKTPLVCEFARPGCDELETIGVMPNDKGLLEVYIKTPPTIKKEYNFFTALGPATKMTFSTTGGYVRDLGLVVDPSTEAYKSVGSFIAIGRIFPDAWNWQAFLRILALLSVMLGVVNLLPIPGLDGGHIVFTIYEMITKRKPSDKFMWGAQIVGFVILGAIMLLAFGNDIMSLFR